MRLVRLPVVFASPLLGQQEGQCERMQLAHEAFLRYGCFTISIANVCPAPLNIVGDTALSKMHGFKRLQSLWHRIRPARLCARG
jgi:hypothetical protein